MSFDTSWASAIMQANAERKATAANERNVRNTNTANLAQSLMARGAPLDASTAALLGMPGLAGQSSALLPYYFGGMENILGGDATSLYMALRGMDINPNVDNYVLPNGNIGPVTAPPADAKGTWQARSHRFTYTDANGVTWSRNKAGERDDGEWTQDTKLEKLDPEMVRTSIGKVQKFKDIVGKYEPAQAQADKLANELMSGEMTRKAISEYEPVAKARIEQAQGKKNASLEALKETLNDIDQIQARKGQGTDAYGTRMLKFNAGRTINSQAASDLGAANLENALGRAAIRQAGRTQQYANLQLPDTMATAAINRSQLPAQAVTQEFGNTMAPFQFFRMGAGSFSPQNLQAPRQYTSNAGLALTGVGAGLSSLANSYLQGKLRDSINKTSTPSAQGGWDYGYDFGGYQPAWSAGSDYGAAGGYSNWETMPID